MPPVPYARDEFVSISRRVEKKFLTLNPQCGILFVSAKPVLSENGIVTTFDLVIGVARFLEEQTGGMAAQHALKEFSDLGFSFNISVYRGISGPSRDEDDARTRAH
jgi:hypothetical protein